jgi:hypothetical protein
MNGESTTGPLVLGRWQKPAALINAGLVPPDPYPVEKLLFCAVCGQQFFGAHIGGTRVYRTFCDCRPGPLPANDVELQVYAETHIHAFDTDTDTDTVTVTGLTTAHYALLAIRFFTRVELGPTADHITFGTRI